MSKKLILGAVLGGLAVFVWGTIWWMALPFSESNLQKFGNEDAMTQAIVDNAPRSGVYFLPNSHSEAGATAETKAAAEAAAWERMQRGPIVFASIQREGFTSMTTAMLSSLLINMIGALLFTWLLMQTKGLNYLHSAVFIAVAALAAGVITRLLDWNWWGFSTGYTVFAIVDIVIGWFLAGLVIAKVAPPKAAS
jgi:hypothetical protein